MEEDKKKIGRAILIACGIFAIFIIGFSFGAAFNHGQGMRDFKAERFNHFEKGQGDKRMGGQGCQNAPIRGQEGGCAKMNNSIEPGCPLQNSLNQVNLAPSTTTETVVK